MTTPETTLAAPRPGPLPEGVDEGTAYGILGGQRSSYTKTLAGGLAALVGNAGKLSASRIALMRAHYQLSAGLLVQSLPIIRADWSIECDDDDAREYLTSAYERISFDLHRSAARSLWAGFSPNSLMLTTDAALGGFVFSDVRDLEPSECSPIVDGGGAFRGILQESFGYVEAIPELVSLWIGEGVESGNYYGRSLLAAALDPFLDSVAFRAFHARYLERFGEPVVKTRAPSGQTVGNQQEIADALAAGKTGTDVPAPELIDNVDQARQIGERLRHHSVVSFPSDLLFGADGKATGFAWDLEYLESSGGGSDAFLEALRECDKRMTRALFVPDLLFAQGDGVGSYALGSSHRDVWVASVEGRLDDYARQITRQLIDRLRVLNFGERCPSARLIFAPQADADRDNLWQAAVALIENGSLPASISSLATRLGIDLADTPEDAPKIPGAMPPAPGPVPPAPALEGARPVVELAAPPADVAGLPDYRLPQSFDPPPYRRELTARERRVGFLEIERAMNRAEASTISTLVDLLERERGRALRQLEGVLRKGSAAEILDALGTIELRGSADAAKEWRTLMHTVGETGLARLRDEIAAYAPTIPEKLGAEGASLIRAYASSSAERVFSSLTTELRFELLNAYTSSVSPAGMAAVVSQTFDAYEAGEGKPVRLTTRQLSAKALNTARADGIKRGGVPLRGAQYSALLDRRTCDLCGELDEKVIPVEHTDLARFTPPVHHNCRCVWVYITRDEEDFTPTWKTPTPSLVERFGGLVIG